MIIHGTHEDIVKRLQRAGGHLASVIQMFEAKRECLDIAQQMHAVIRALENAKTEFIRDHIDHCLEDSLNQKAAARKASLEEFKEITKYL